MPNTSKLLQTATTHHRAGRLKDAEKAYNKLLQAEATHIDGLRLSGGLYIQMGQFVAAVQRLQAAVDMRPKDPEILTNLGIALRKVGRQQEAITSYKQALALKPDYLSALNNLGSLYHDTGRMAEALSLYGQALQLNPDNPAAHYNYGNSLFVAGRAGEAIARYEHALTLKPDYLEAMINLGMALSQTGMATQSRQWLAVAQTWFEKALKADPNNVVAMNNIGNVLRQQGKPGEAITYYQKALAIKPDYVQASINMATSLRDVNRIDEAIESCRDALRLAPNSSDAYINLGAFLQELALHHEAIDHFTKALEIKPSAIDATWNKSLSLLALGQYQEGWDLHEIGLGIAHMRGEYPSSERRWKGESVEGKRLLIWCEQGLGDSLQFIRYAELCKARGAEIIVLCPPPLRPLFRNCSFIDKLPESVEEQDFDFHVPMMSLPYIFATRVDTIPTKIPYLFVSDAARARWAHKLSPSDAFKIGLVWSGNPRENQLNAHMIDKRRSMNLDMLRPLLDVEGVQFYNLQMGANAKQIDQYGLRGRIIDLMDNVKDFEDTGVLVEHLDLVLSVDTSVVHLVGGMGRPVWVMSRFDACWRWLQNQTDNPWYLTAKVFGQKSPGDWTATIDEVRKALMAEALS